MFLAYVWEYEILWIMNIPTNCVRNIICELEIAKYLEVVKLCVDVRVWPKNLTLARTSVTQISKSCKEI